MAGRRVKMLTPQGSQDWRIVSRRLPRNQHTSYYGLCCFDKHAIIVDPRLDDETAIRTVIHEAAHVALGEDYGEPAIERIEHNVYVTLVQLLRSRFDIDMED